MTGEVEMLLEGVRRRKALAPGEGGKEGGRGEDELPGYIVGEDSGGVRRLLVQVLEFGFWRWMRSA